MPVFSMMPDSLVAYKIAHRILGMRFKGVNKMVTMTVEELDDYMQAIVPGTPLSHSQRDALKLLFTSAMEEIVAHLPVCGCDRKIANIKSRLTRVPDHGTLPSVVLLQKYLG